MWRQRISSLVIWVVLYHITVNEMCWVCRYTHIQMSGMMNVNICFTASVLTACQFSKILYNQRHYQVETYIVCCPKFAGDAMGYSSNRFFLFWFLLLLRSQSHAQTSSPVLTRKSAVRRRDAVGPQSFSFRSTGYGQVSCLRVLCDGQDWRMCSGVWESVPHGHSSVWASLSL